MNVIVEGMSMIVRVMLEVIAFLDDNNDFANGCQLH
jgi:hypothetical protein